jgi:hypothetical protein
MAQAPQGPTVSTSAAQPAHIEPEKTNPPSPGNGAIQQVSKDTSQVKFFSGQELKGRISNLLEVGSFVLSSIKNVALRIFGFADQPEKFSKEKEAKIRQEAFENATREVSTEQFTQQLLKTAEDATKIDKDTKTDNNENKKVDRKAEMKKLERSGVVDKLDAAIKKINLRDPGKLNPEKSAEFARMREGLTLISNRISNYLLDGSDNRSVDPLIDEAKSQLKNYEATTQRLEEKSKVDEDARLANIKKVAGEQRSSLSKYDVRSEQKARMNDLRSKLKKNGPGDRLLKAAFDKVDNAVKIMEGRIKNLEKGTIYKPEDLREDLFLDDVISANQDFEEAVQVAEQEILESNK